MSEAEEPIPQEPEPLPDDTEVDLEAEFQSSNIQEVLDKLDRELVGLKPVKTRIRETAALLLVDRVRKQVHLSSETPTLHMCFTGNPGTGKTTVAMRMGEILKRLGYVREGHLVTVTRDDLVGQYIGHTAPKTKESIEILLQIMENNRDDLVVILAGYKDKMDRFFQSNPGMRSRIAHHIDFPDYQPDELLAIGKLMLAEQNYRFSPDGEKAFAAYIDKRMQLEHFANGRSIRNALDRARLRQANRLFAASGKKLTKLDLMTLESEDILASRVFSEGKLDTVNGGPPPLDIPETE
jgi:Cdc6-like AAA superfamily ATPase